jgi:hypothetical protein
MLKFELVGFLGMAGLIAVSAGPSSAILMILPQTRTWSTGSVSFHLAGTADQLWPATLTAFHIGGPDRHP